MATATDSLSSAASSVDTSSAGSPTDLTPGGMIGSVDWGGSGFDGSGFDAAADDGSEVSEEPEIEESPAVEEPEESEEPAVEEPEAEEPEVESAPVDQAATPTDLPEGVRESTVNGKKEMRLTPARYETFHQAHRTLRDLEAKTGIPATPEALETYNKAFMGQERLYTDLLSAEPQAQAKVFDHFIQEAARAVADGEVASDPVVGMASAFYDTVQKNPDAYASLRMRAATDLVSEMYGLAQQLQADGKPGARDLAVSVSHLAKNLGLPYKKDAEITQHLSSRPVNADPVTRLQAENQRLQEQLKGRDTQSATAQWSQWASSTKQATTAAVLQDAILPSLSAESKQWGQFPKEFQERVVNPLRAKVHEVIGNDAAFGARIKLLDQNARRAVSEQKRAQYATEIKQAYVSRAALAIDHLKGPVLRDAAKFFKAGNDAKHARLQAGQSQRNPRGTQAAVPRSLIPNGIVKGAGSDTFDAKSAARELQQLMGM